MYTRLAYLGVILIWSTTPLAIKWSSEGAGFLFALASRMSLGLVGALLILLLFNQTIPLHRQAIKTYITSGVSMYLAMTGVYWASLHIPSGWISVVFGISPILTGFMATLILKENAVTAEKLVGMVMGFIGLMLVFGNGYTTGNGYIAGIMIVLMSTIVHSMSAVMIKSFEARLSGVASATGGLLVGTPLFLITWLVVGETIPAYISMKAIVAILYLGLVASTLGFAIYYYILTRMDVGRVSLITLITPVCALFLGNTLNSEPVSLSVLIGTGCIITGLVFYQFGQKALRYVLDR